MASQRQDGRDREVIKIGPLNVETVRGEPYYIGGRKLIPLARIVSLGNARATIGSRGIGGWAGGAAWIKPLAVLEETPAGERRIPIADRTAATIRRQLAMAAIVVFFFVALRRLASRLRAARMRG
jgi:uncharacterized spore protein YtfJ